MEGDNSASDEKLLESSASGDIDGVVAALAEGGRVTVRNHRGATPLFLAALVGHTDICGLLLAHGSNVNEVEPNTKLTALHLASAHGHNAFIEALLSWEAEIDPKDVAGFTPLAGACEVGHLLCVLTLLKAGASLTLPDNQGSLPIHQAAGNNRMEIVKTLLEHGCSPDMVSVFNKKLFVTFLLSETAKWVGHH